MLSLWICLLGACGGGGGGGGGGAAPATAAAAIAPEAVTVAALAKTQPQVAAPTSAAAREGMRFGFELPAARTTSAGVYDADGRLVRTLWRGERLPAGQQQRSWNHRLDDGSVAAPGRYSVRLVHHDIRYRWDGIIGNSSAALAAQQGTAPFRSYRVPQSLALDGAQLHIGLGYNEAQTALIGLDVRNPQRPAARVRHTDPFVAFGLIASDGQRLYAANTGHLSLSKRSFVVAFDLASGAQAVASGSTPLCLNFRSDGRTCYEDQNYRGVLALRPDGAAGITGLAVQKNGPMLALAYGAESLVRVYDKQSGAVLAEISAALAQHGDNHLAIGPDGDLWVLARHALQRWRVAAGTATLLQEAEGIENPLAVAVDPLDANTVWVADGGASQQLRRFGSGGSAPAASAERGAATALVATGTIGARGGLQADAAVSDARLCFQLEATQEHTALAVDMQHRIWVVDTCNNRLLLMNPSGVVQQRVAYLPSSYVSTVDGNNPQRVFANFLEYAVDGSLPAGAPGAWRLVRNWLPSLPATLRDADSANVTWGGPFSVQTLANGRSYAMLRVNGQQVITELAASGRVREVLRLANAPIDVRSGYAMHASGDLVHAANEGGLQVAYRLALKGFDAGGDPRWAREPQRLAAAPTGTATPWHRPGVFTGVGPPRLPITDSGVVVWLNGAVDGPDGFHLGAVKLGASDWAWQASPSGPIDGRGSFQTRRSDPTIHYGGNVAMASGRSIVYGYHGEFFTDATNGKVGQANQFMHFLDNGLFLGQFGFPSTRRVTGAEPGLSGNAFSPSLVRDRGRLFLYHNDESSWGGVQRWIIEGADELAEISASGALGSSLQLR